MRRWLQWKRGAKVMAGQPEPVGLSTVLGQTAGKWVAVDRDTNELRLAADSPYELAMEIRRRGVSNVAVVRAPDPSEPELVGLG